MSCYPFVVLATLSVPPIADAHLLGSQCIWLASQAGVSPYTHAYLELLPDSLSRQSMIELIKDPLKLPVFSSAGEFVNQGLALQVVIESHIRPLPEARRQEVIAAIKIGLQKRLDNFVDRAPIHEQRMVRRPPILDPMIWDVDAQGIYALEFSADDSKILTVTKTQAELWDARTGHSLGAFLHFESHSLIAAALSPLGDRVAAMDKQGWIYIWDAQSGVLKNSFQQSEASEGYLVFSPDGKALVAGNDEGEIKFWNIANETVEHSGKSPITGYADIFFSPTGTQYITRSSFASVEGWSYPDHKKLFSLHLKSTSLQAVRYSALGKTVLTVNDGEIQTWDSTDGALLGSVPFDDWNHGAHDLFPSLNLLASTSGDPNRVHLNDTLTGKRIISVPSFEHKHTKMKFSHDGQHLALIIWPGGKLAVYPIGIRGDR